ncbi:hypothetical protein JTB14_013328 [Gonioctena quinquepunctata]|nr:hypothetical protein JTB14_013328 [Gonioctena quinquepunctata]
MGTLQRRENRPRDAVVKRRLSKMGRATPGRGINLCQRREGHPLPRHHPKDYGQTKSKIQRAEGTGLVSISAVVEGTKVEIILSEYPNQLIHNGHLERLQRAIMEAIEKIPEVDIQIRFLGCTQRPGWQVLTCANQESRDWLNTTVESLEPREGAALRAFPRQLLGQIWPLHQWD